MSYVRKKTIKGNVYLYEQKCERVNGCVKTSHVRYIGKEGVTNNIKNVVPNHIIGDKKYKDDSNEYSFDRFNLDFAKKISGGGSDRDVYEFPDGKIIKIAKSPRGLQQNDGWDSFLKLMPNQIEKGKDYVIFEKINRDDKRSNAMLKNLKKYSVLDWDKKPESMQNELARLDKKYNDIGFTDSMNYDLLYNDFTSARNWGWKNNRPYHIDEGTFNKQILDKSSMSQDDYNKIKNARSVARSKNIKVLV